ncbi:MAG: hypothetical protein QOH62_1645 [Solirubrobacteraceae bacterium]|jgi:uncharacterized RDD family membrane protein YckC|nr:hypothetical protein [Solirubrobacteraceae bacterium]
MTAPAAPAYAGIVTRALGLIVDLAIVNSVLLATTVTVGALVAAVVPGRQSVGTPEILLTTAASVVFSACYFVGFWVLAGQTPGMRLMGIAVTCERGEPLTLGRAVRRLVGFVLTVLTLGIGFLLVLLDDRRRALQDVIAGTVVVRGR